MGPTLVVEKAKSGGYFVTSPDNRGLLVWGATKHDALKQVPAALDDLRRALSDRPI